MNIKANPLSSKRSCAKVLFCSLISFTILSACLSQKIIPSNLASVPSPSIGLSNIHNETGTSYPSSVSRNFVRQLTVHKPITDASSITASLSIFEASMTTQYYDGLGRPHQNVDKASTPQGKDVVTPFLYDTYGRQVYKYVPYASTTNDGSFKTAPFAEQQSFMQNQFPGESVFYNEDQFEPSPLNRIQKSLAPGNSWAGSNKGMQFKYLLNTALDQVHIWTIGFDQFTYTNSDNTSNIPFTSSSSGNSTGVSIRTEAESYTNLDASVFKENTGDTEGGVQNVGSLDNGDDLLYTVNVPAAGAYTVKFRMAAVTTNVQAELFSGSQSLGVINIQKTGDYPAGFQQYQYSVPVTIQLQAGQQTIRIRSLSGGWNFNWWDLASSAAPSTGVSIRTEAESYTNLDASVFKENTGDTEGGVQNVGSLDNGDDLLYTVNVPAAGAYTVKFRMAAVTTNVQAELFSGSQSLGVINIQKTGDYPAGFQQYQYSVPVTIQLQAGQQTIRIRSLSGGWNFNWWDLASSAAPSTGVSIRTEAESYTNLDASVFKENTGDTEGGVQNVGSLDNGDDLLYTVNVPAAGAYTVKFRMAAVTTNVQAELFSGSQSLGVINIQKTGDYPAGFQQYQYSVPVTIQLQAGQQTIRIRSLSGGWNFNWWDLASVGSTQSGSSIGLYEEGQLYKNVTIDEDGKITVEYKDKQNQVVLKKQQLDNTISSDYTGYQGFLCTYYVYDDLNQLRFVIPPKAIEAIKSDWSLTNHLDVVQELCFRYEYDTRGRMIAKKLPGTGWIYMIYDARDRLVIKQDANGRSKGENLYMKYDNFNRQVATGLLVGNYSAATLQSQAYESMNYPELSLFASNDLTYTYYDNYSWAGNPFGSSIVGFDNDIFFAASNSVFPYPRNVVADNAVTGLITGTKVKVLDGTSTGNYLYTTTFYDDFSRPVQVRRTCLEGKIESTTNQYGFDGKLLRSYVRSNFGTPEEGQIQYVTSNTYDGGGRLTDISKRVLGISGNPYKIIAKYSYDELGRLLTKDLGNKPDNTPVESLTYTNNIRGWLTGINRNYALGQNSSNLFGMQLSYDYGFGLSINGSPPSGSFKYLNGNIAGTVWKTAGSDEQRAYGFAYDDANRLTKADFTQNNSGWNTASGVDFSVELGDQVRLLNPYDANGNIISMKQSGLKVNGSNLIDDLLYEYHNGGNKLKKVTDGIAVPAQGSALLGDFLDKNTAGNDYGYDVNGNLLTDMNKGIGSASSAEEDVNNGGIAYNYLNLPNLIEVKDNGNVKGTIQFIYDALGNKLRKVVTENSNASSNSISSVTTTSYVAGGIFESKNYSQPDGSHQNYQNRLQLISHEEGRIRFKKVFVSGCGITPVSARIDPKKPITNSCNSYYEQQLPFYDYFVKDHLGNVRMVLTDENLLDGYPTVTFEGNNLGNEKQSYENVDVSRVSQNNFSSSGTNTAQLLSKTTHSVGVGKLLKVMVKDRLHIKVDYYVPGGTNNANPDGLSSLIASLVSIFSGSSAPAGLKGDAGTITGALNSSNAAMTFFYPQGPNIASSKPKAYLNILFFDEQFKFIVQNSESIQVNTVGGVDHIERMGSAAKEVQKNGYAYIYISNESNDNVYFDNFQVSHERGPVLEETHYYPFGLTMAGISSKAAGGMESKKKFQGQEFAHNEFSDGSGLEMYEFKWRMDDPQTGRFWQVDPLSDKYVYNSPYAFSENKVTVHRELEGLEAEYIFHKAKQEIASTFQGAANWIDNTISYFTKSESSTVVASTPISTTSVGSSVTTNTSTNFGGNMAYIIYNNTNKGNTEPLTKTTTTVTAETKTDIKVAGVTATNKTGVSNTGVITNEVGAKKNVVIDGLPTTVGGSVSKNSNGQTTIKAEGTTNIPVSVVQGTAQVQYSTNGKQQSTSLGVGGQVTSGKTTSKSLFGITFNW